MGYKITYSDFEAKLQIGEPYTGLVQGVGYVYWEDKPIYFAKIYQAKNMKTGNLDGYKQPPVKNFGFTGKSVYFQVNEIESFTFKAQRFDVVTKIQKNIKTISPEQLLFQNSQLYYDYYDGKPPSKVDEYQNGAHINKNDEIKPVIKDSDVELLRTKVKKSTTPLDPIERGGEWIRRDVGLQELDQMAKVGKEVDDAIGTPLEIVEEFASKSKAIPILGNVISGLSIISDINDGEYYSAAGELITSCARIYGTIWELGAMYIESEKFILSHYFSTQSEYWKAQKKYEENPNGFMNHTNYLNKKQSYKAAEECFNDLMNKRKNLKYKQVK